jgi:hypothetical protein
MKGSKIIWVLLSIWLAVSAYFYLEHRVTVKTMDIPGWELDQNSKVIFKKIELMDKGRKTNASFFEPTRRMQILNACKNAPHCSARPLIFYTFILLLYTPIPR